MGKQIKANIMNLKLQLKLVTKTAKKYLFFFGVWLFFFIYFFRLILSTSELSIPGFSFQEILLFCLLTTKASYLQIFTASDWLVAKQN